MDLTRNRYEEKDFPDLNPDTPVVLPQVEVTQTEEPQISGNQIRLYRLWPRVSGTFKLQRSLLLSSSPEPNNGLSS